MLGLALPFRVGRDRARGTPDGRGALHRLARATQPRPAAPPIHAPSPRHDDHADEEPDDDPSQKRVRQQRSPVRVCSLPFTGVASAARTRGCRGRGPPMSEACHRANRVRTPTSRRRDRSGGRAGTSADPIPDQRHVGHSRAGVVVALKIRHRILEDTYKGRGLPRGARRHDAQHREHDACGRVTELQDHIASFAYARLAKASVSPPKTSFPRA